MFALYKKEISSFLSSLIGYIVIIIFLLITGLFLWVLPVDFNIMNFGYAQMDGLFILAPYVFLLLIPAITMKSFAEEKKTGTLELLLTKPLSENKIIAAKFLAALTLMVLAILPTLIYYFSVYRLGFPVGNIDHGGTIGSYIGLLFLGAAFISIGMFASSLTSNQIVSFILAIFLSGAIYIGFELIYQFQVLGSFGLIIKSLGINDHYISISRGVIDTRDIIYFISVVLVFLMMTRLSIQSRKW